MTGFVHQLGKKGYRDQSIDVRGDWPVLFEFSKNQLEKLNPITPSSVTIAAQCGEVFQYNQDIDKTRVSKPLVLSNQVVQVFANVPTLEDPVIKRLA